MENSLPIINFHIQIYQSLDSPRRITRSTKIYCASARRRTRGPLAREETGRFPRAENDLPALFPSPSTSRSSHAWYRTRVHGVLLFVIEATSRRNRHDDRFAAKSLRAFSAVVSDG